MSQAKNIVIMKNAYSKRERESEYRVQGRIPGNRIGKFHKIPRNWYTGNVLDKCFPLKFCHRFASFKLAKLQIKIDDKLVLKMQLHKFIQTRSKSNLNKIHLLSGTFINRV